MSAPKAFVSHSTCDLTFCLELYEALQNGGISPIMFERDVFPGDDWVDKVFEGGIGTSDAVIFVLSPESVDRPGLRLELSASVVERLRRRTRLIPVLFDLPDDNVPRVLLPFKWIPVGTGVDAKSVASEIASVMHSDAGANPTIEPEPPQWTRTPLSARLNLDPRDEASLSKSAGFNSTPL